jgi:tetratricopeptide (TPR) repeat protein
VELPEAVHRQKLNIVDNTPEQITEAVTYFFEHIIQGKPLSPEDVQIQKNYSDALDKLGVEGGGLVIPGFARQYPETWSLNSAEDAKASIAVPRSVPLSSCPLNAPDCMTPAQLEGVLTSTAGEMEQVLQQALEHHQSTLLRQAMEHHRAARLAEAAILYEHILRADVPHPDALHLLGQIHLQQGAVDQAETRFAQAIAVRPDVAAYSLNHGLALHRLGRNSEALAAFTRAQALDPTLSEAHHQAGNVLKSLGRHGEAIMALHEAVRLVRSRSPVSARHHDVTVVQSSSLP